MDIANLYPIHIKDRHIKTGACVATGSAPSTVAKDQQLVSILRNYERFTSFDSLLNSFSKSSKSFEIRS